MINVHPAALGAMRASAESLMTDTCTIEAQADVTGDMGEPLQDQYTLVASGVVCRVITLGQGRFKDEAKRQAERETIDDVYRIVCPYDTALAVDQRVTLDSDSSQWQVTDLVTERTDSVDAQAIISRIQG